MRRDMGKDLRARGRAIVACARGARQPGALRHDRERLQGAIRLSPQNHGAEIGAMASVELIRRIEHSEIPVDAVLLNVRVLALPCDWRILQVGRGGAVSAEPSLRGEADRL